MMLFDAEELKAVATIMDWACMIIMFRLPWSDTPSSNRS